MKSVQLDIFSSEAISAILDTAKSLEETFIDLASTKGEPVSDVLNRFVEIYKSKRNKCKMSDTDNKRYELGLVVLELIQYKYGISRKENDHGI